MIKLNRYQTAALKAIFASEGIREDIRLTFQGNELAKIWPRYQLRKKRVAELREMGLIRWEYPTETASGRWVLTRPGTTRLLARG
jgi:hypothetical protein